MAIRTLRFRGTAQWVLQGAKAKVEEKTKALVTIHYPNPAVPSGTLKIEAPGRGEVNKAVSLLLSNHFYSSHLRE